MSQLIVVKCTYYCLHYTIYPAQCNPPCSPEGRCIEPNVCACPSGLEGKQCEIGKHNCAVHFRFIFFNYHNSNILCIS